MRRLLYSGLFLLASCGWGKGRLAPAGTSAQDALLNSMSACGCEAPVEFVRTEGMYALALIRYPVADQPQYWHCVDDAWMKCRKFHAHIQASTPGCRSVPGGEACIQGVAVRPGFYGVSDTGIDFIPELERRVAEALAELGP
jgi:hypothetical protein